MQAGFGQGCRWHVTSVSPMHVPEAPSPIGQSRKRRSDTTRSVPGATLEWHVAQERLEPLFARPGRLALAMYLHHTAGCAHSGLSAWASADSVESRISACSSPMIVATSVRSPGNLGHSLYTTGQAAGVQENVQRAAAYSDVPCVCVH